ncbi:MAG TPA: hypothetical protein VFJ16_25165 [Longimicrobium sp.]|nr:hypothetical protein [Longimicrobium sp.]
MRRTLVCLGILVLAGTTALSAQRRERERERCRRYGDGHVVICDRDRDRDRRPGRDWDRGGPWRDRGPVEFGIRGGYDFEDGQGSVGTQVRIPLIRQFAVSPSFDAFLGDNGAAWQANLDGLIRPRALGGLYGGGGLAVLRRDFDGLGDQDTSVGWNLVAGIEGNRVARSALRPFAEARWTGVEDFDGFRLVAGVNVPVSGLGR